MPDKQNEQQAGTRQEQRAADQQADAAQADRQDDRQGERRKAEMTQQKAAAQAAATVEAQEMAYTAEVMRRTGWGEAEANTSMRRLREKGDFFDDEGRWTLDNSGYPVCLYGWKEEKIADL